MNAKSQTTSNEDGVTGVTLQVAGRVAIDALVRMSGSTSHNPSRSNDDDLNVKKHDA